MKVQQNKKQQPQESLPRVILAVDYIVGYYSIRQDTTVFHDPEKKRYLGYVDMGMAMLDKDTILAYSLDD